LTKYQNNQHASKYLNIGPLNIKIKRPNADFKKKMLKMHFTVHAYEYIIWSKMNRGHTILYGIFVSVHYTKIKKIKNTKAKCLINNSTDLPLTNRCSATRNKFFLSMYLLMKI
jgi:hypothetical protein